jgi:hypothetical protein
MFDIDHLLSVIKSVLTPEEYKEYLANLSAELEKNPIDDSSYYAFIGEVNTKR